MTQKQKNMLEGPIYPLILTIAFPIMVNNLIRTLYNLTDGLYVAQISAEDFAATAFIWPLNFLFISLGMGIGVAATSLIAQKIGAHQIDEATTYTKNTVLLTYIIGFILSVIGYLASPHMIEWMGAEGSFFEKANIYLQINFIGLFFDFTYFGYQSLLNAQGKTKIITIISAFSSLINVFLDPFLIFEKIPILNISGLNMGIAGAAWATVVAKFALFIFVLMAVKRESIIQIPFTQLSAKWQTMKEIFLISLPSALGYGGAALGFTVLNGLIESYGTSTLAAYSMVNRISDLLTQPLKQK